MNEVKTISEISEGIWSSCENRPTRMETQPFDQQLQRVNIKDFIVYNFLNYQGTALSELLLSIFKFWKDLNLKDWGDIFDRLKGNQLAEYYMAIFAGQYLGIDPEFSSTKDVEIVHFTTADQRYQSGKPSLFVDNMEGELREIEREGLNENFGIAIEDFVELSNKLTLQNR